MGVFYAQQPNGLYCRFSSIVDCPTDWNMTKEELVKSYIDEYIERAKDEIERMFKRGLPDFERVKERISILPT